MSEQHRWTAKYPFLQKVYDHKDACPDATLKQMYNNVAHGALDSFVLNFLPVDHVLYVGEWELSVPSHPDTGKWSLTKQRFVAATRNSHRHRVYFLALTLRFPDHSGHSNILILNSADHTARLVEPHGSDEEPWTQGLNKVLERLLERGDLLPKDEHEPKKKKEQVFHLAPMDSFCPRLGTQALTGDSLCHAWSLLSMALYSVYPDRYADIQKHLTASGKTYLTDLTRGWLCYIRLQEKVARLQQGLAKIDKQIFALEQQYTKETEHGGKLPLLNEYDAALARIRALATTSVKMQYGLDLSRRPFDAKSHAVLWNGFFTPDLTTVQQKAVKTWWSAFRITENTHALELTVNEGEDDASEKQVEHDVRVPEITFDITSEGAARIRSWLVDGTLECSPALRLTWNSTADDEVAATFRLGLEATFLGDLYEGTAEADEQYAREEGWSVYANETQDLMDYDGQLSYDQLVAAVLANSRKNDSARAFHHLQRLLTTAEHARLTLTIPLRWFAKQNHLPFPETILYARSLP